jgi:hypothetical protein
MKQNSHLLLSGTASFICTTLICTTLHGQNWINGGNTLAANGTFGTNSNHSVIFETAGMDRGRITNTGNWGIGSAGSASKFTINSAAGVSPFRAQINGASKLIIGTNGGVSIGSPNPGPANGLYVLGSVGVGTTLPAFKLHVIGTIYGASSTPNSGVFGFSSYSGGEGVRGQSPYIGVYGYAGSYGVYGVSYNNGYGVYGGGLYGVYGLSTVGGGNAIYGTTGQPSSYGVFASSSQAIGIYAYTGNVNSYAGYFAGRVHSTGGFTSSDRKLKQDIKDLDLAMDIINKLQPKTYRFRQDGNYKLMNLPQGNHYGLIAQDVEELLPNLVANTEFDPSRIIEATRLSAQGLSQQGPNTSTQASQQNKEEVIDFKSLNYTELIPILVKGMQELSAENKKLLEEITSLKETLIKLGDQRNSYPKTAWMNQNTPNPVSTSTTIQYSIPDNVRSARILITNMKGQQLKVYNVNGQGSIRFNAGTLPSGTYNYSMVTDGKTITTKKLVISR